MATREVIDEVIIETKAFGDGLIFLIYGKLKFFDKAGNIVLSKITKQQKANILKPAFTSMSKPSEIKLPDYYKKAVEIHIQRQIVSKLIVLSKKEVEAKNKE